MADEETETKSAEPQKGEPGYYNPPSVDAGVTKSRPNEVTQAESGAGKSTKDEDLESYTVPELKDLAEKRGIEIHSDMLKSDIIDALKAG